MSDYIAPKDDEDLSLDNDYDLEGDISNDWDNLGSPSAEVEDSKPIEGEPVVENTTTTEPITTEENTGSELELKLVPETDSKYNEKLVDSVENLLMHNYLELEDEQIVELFDGTEEGWHKVMKANAEALQVKAVQAVWDSIPERGREFFQYLNSAGAAARIDEWLSLEKVQAEYEAIEVDKLTDQQAKEIITRNEKERGSKQRYIDAVILSLEDDNELIKTAKEIVTEQKAVINAAKVKQLADDKARIEAKEKADKAKFESTVKAIQNTNYAKTKQEEIYNMIYKADASGVSPIIAHINNVFNKPEHLIQLATLFDGFDPEKGFNLAQLKAQVKTEITKDVKKTIKRTTNANKTTGGSSGDAFKGAKNWQPSDEELGLYN